MNNAKADYNLFLVFDAINTEANLTRAGAKLGLSQPAISHALTRLRQLYDDPLFVRTSQGMLPTPMAESLAPVIRDGLSRLESTLRQDNVFDPATSAKVFRLAMTDYGAATLLPPILNSVNSAAPNVAIKINRLDEKNILKKLESKEIDLAFSSQIKAGADFYEKVLFRDEFVCVVSKNNQSIKQRLTLKSFLAAEHLLYTPQEGDIGVVDLAVKKLGHTYRTTCYIPHALGIPLALKDSEFIITLPKRLAESLNTVGLFRLLSPPIEIVGFEMKLIWHRITLKDPANQWFRSICLKLFRQRC